MGQPLAQHAEPDRGPAVPRHRPVGGEQPRHRPGDRHPVRTPGRPLDRRPRPSPAPSTSWTLPGVRFVPARFTPRERQYAKGQECQGVQIALTDWATFEPVDLGDRRSPSRSDRLYPQPVGARRLPQDARRPRRLRGPDGRRRTSARSSSTWDAELAEFNPGPGEVSDSTSDQRSGVGWSSSSRGEKRCRVVSGAARPTIRPV